MQLKDLSGYDDSNKNYPVARYKNYAIHCYPDSTFRVFCKTSLDCRFGKFRTLRAAMQYIDNVNNPVLKINVSELI